METMGVLSCVVIAIFWLLPFSLGQIFSEEATRHIKYLVAVVTLVLCGLAKRAELAVAKQEFLAMRRQLETKRQSFKAISPLVPEKFVAVPVRVPCSAAIKLFLPKSSFSCRNQAFLIVRSMLIIRRRDKKFYLYFLVFWFSDFRMFFISAQVRRRDRSKIIALTDEALVVDLKGDLTHLLESALGSMHCKVHVFHEGPTGLTAGIQKLDVTKNGVLAHRCGKLLLDAASLT